MNSLARWGELRTQVHEWAKSKGWWENPNRDIDEQFANFVAEVSEAWEEYRRGDMMTWWSFRGERFDISHAFITEPGENVPKPEGYWSEMADVVIRIADTCGRYNWFPTLNDKVGPFKKTPAALCCKLNLELTSAWSEVKSQCNREPVSLAVVVRTIFSQATLNGVDLWNEIDLKMAYNETRSWRHGNKQA